MKQKTIRHQTIFEGVGIHSGERARVYVCPSQPDSGIEFSFNGKLTPAKIKNVTGDKLATSLGEIRMVEHLLAALHGLEVTNVDIRCLSAEIPVMDGSSKSFIDEFLKCGITEQDAEIYPLSLKNPVEIKEKAKWIIAEPAENFSIDFEIDFPVIGRQVFSFDGSPASFVKEIAPARTFGFEKDLEELHKNGFAKGATLQNSLGISESGYLTPPRFENEPVRHKILDLIGDLALLGRPLNAKIKAYKSSHRLNHELVRQLAELK